MVEKSRKPNGTSFDYKGRRRQLGKTAAGEGTYADPSKSQLIANFLGFGKQSWEFLATKLIGTKKTANVTDSGFEDTRGKRLTLKT